MRYLFFESDLVRRDTLLERFSSDIFELSDYSDSDDGSSLSLPRDGCQRLIDTLARYPALVSVLFLGCCDVGPQFRNAAGGLSTSCYRPLWLVPILVAHARAVAQLRRRPYSVHFLVETPHMVADDADAVSRTLRAPAQNLDSAQWSACVRPRSFWTSLGPRPDLVGQSSISPASLLDPGWLPLWNLSAAPPNTRHGHRWLAPRPPDGPNSEDELGGFCRNHLAMYTDFGLAYHSQTSAPDLAKLSDLVHRCIRTSAETALFTPGSSDFNTRGELVRRVHLGDLRGLVRPLHPHEAELALGLPIGASSFTGDKNYPQPWQRLCHLSQGLSVPVLAGLLAPFADAAASGRSASVIGPGPTATTRDEALATLPSSLGGSGARTAGQPRSSASRVAPSTR